MTTLMAATAAAHFGTPGAPPVTPEEGGRITLDETTTYATASFDIPMLDADVVDTLDPRGAGMRVHLYVGASWYNLGLRSRTVIHATRTIHIEAASDEALLAEYRRLTNISYTALAGSVRDVVSAVLDLVIPGAALLASPPIVDGPVLEADALIWTAGTSAWDFLAPLTASIGGRLFCDELRDWRLVPTSYTQRGTITAQPSNAREAEDTLSRDGEQWVTGVAVRYRWTTPAGVAMERIDAAGVPGKVDIIDFDTPYPGPGVAAARLRRLAGQGRMQTADCVAQYHARPGMEVRFALPGAPEQIGRLQRVEFPLLDGFMALQVRELTEAPPSAWIYLLAGDSWLDSPTGESWIDEAV